MIYEGMLPRNGNTVQIQASGGSIRSVAETLSASRSELPNLGWTDICSGVIDHSAEWICRNRLFCAYLGLEKIERVARAIASSGTLTHLATITTNSKKRIVDNSGIIAVAVGGVLWEEPQSQASMLRARSFPLRMDPGGK